MDSNRSYSSGEAGWLGVGVTASKATGAGRGNPEASTLTVGVPPISVKPKNSETVPETST